MIISRSTPGSKLLARHEHDNGSFPFATADWLPGTAIDLSLVSNRLRLTAGSVPTAASHTHTRRDIAARGKAFIQTEIAVISIEVGTSGNSGPAAHIPTDNLDGVSASSTTPSASTNLFLRDVVDGTPTTISSSAVGATTLGAFRRISLFVNGVAAEAYDFTSAAQVSGNSAHYSTGRVGIQTNENKTYECRRFLACADRFVTVTGLEAGYLVEIRSSVDAVFVQAEEIAGQVVIDMMEIPLHQATKLVVLDSSETEIATYEVSGLIIEPGETYVLEEGEPPPEQTIDPDLTEVDFPATIDLGNPINLTITTFDTEGAQMEVGGATIVVAMYVGIDTVFPTVTDNEDGTYSASYTPLEGGAQLYDIYVNDVLFNPSGYSTMVLEEGEGPPGQPVVGLVSVGQTSIVIEIETEGTDAVSHWAHLSEVEAEVFDSENEVSQIFPPPASLNLSGLTPGTTYYIGIKALNAFGTTNSEIITVQTLPADPEPEPEPEPVDRWETCQDAPPNDDIWNRSTKSGSSAPMGGGGRGWGEGELEEEIQEVEDEIAAEGGTTPPPTGDQYPWYAPDGEWNDYDIPDEELDEEEYLKRVLFPCNPVPVLTHRNDFNVNVENPTGIEFADLTQSIAFDGASILDYSFKAEWQFNLGEGGLCQNTKNTHDWWQLNGIMSPDQILNRYVAAGGHALIVGDGACIGGLLQLWTMRVRDTLGRKSLELWYFTGALADATASNYLGQDSAAIYIPSQFRTGAFPGSRMLPIRGWGLQPSWGDQNSRVISYQKIKTAIAQNSAPSNALPRVKINSGQCEGGP